MIGPYLDSNEMDQLEKLLEHAAKDTIGCWIATRLNGASAGLACNGNISLCLLEALDKRMMPVVEKAKRNTHQEGLDRVASTPMPQEQKFPIGAKVQIAADLGPTMSHFHSGLPAVVKYTYAHAYGGSEKEQMVYCLDVEGIGEVSWYYEDQLTKI